MNSNELHKYLLSRNAPSKLVDHLAQARNEAGLGRKTRQMLIGGVKRRGSGSPIDNVVGGILRSPGGRVLFQEMIEAGAGPEGAGPEGAGCGDILRFRADACELYQCTESIIGKSSDSTSPSDTWFLNFKPGTTYDGEPLHTAFMKWWINPDTVHGASERRLRFSRGLDYETRVQRDIIEPLRAVCPHFTRFLAAGKGCSFADIRRIMTAGRDDFAFVTAVERHIIRNLVYMRINAIHRPSVTETGKLPPMIGDEILNEVRNDFYYPWTYNVMINEKHPPCSHGCTFKVFMDKMGGDYPDVVWLVIYQVLVACYAMSLSGVTHNDLHFGNVVVEDLGQAEVFVYEINGETCFFRSRYMARVFDYDRAYVERFGDNPLLVGPMSDTLNQRNEFVPNKDFVKFLQYFRGLIKARPGWDEVRGLLAGGANEPDPGTITNRLVPGEFLMRLSQMGGGQRFMGKRDFSKLNTPSQILVKARQMLVHTLRIAGDDPADPTIQGIFVCRLWPDMFAPDGVLKGTEAPPLIRQDMVPELREVLDGSDAAIAEAEAVDQEVRTRRSTSAPTSKHLHMLARALTAVRQGSAMLRERREGFLMTARGADLRELMADAREMRRLMVNLLTYVSEAQVAMVEVFGLA